MTLVRSEREHITILDFSSGEASKNKIKQSLKSVRVSNASNINSRTLTIFDYYIKIGVYKIKLILSEDFSQIVNNKCLKDYGKFGAIIFEDKKEINLLKDSKFKEQYWIKNSKNNTLSNLHLTEMIYFCQRLNSLKSFF